MPELSHVEDNWALADLGLADHLPFKSLVVPLYPIEMG